MSGAAALATLPRLGFLLGSALLAAGRPWGAVLLLPWGLAAVLAARVPVAPDVARLTAIEASLTDLRKRSDDAELGRLTRR